jgi:cytoskeletal protein CcmA (bactofilin family)
MGTQRFYEKFGHNYELYPAGETHTGNIAGDPGETRNIRILGEYLGDINLPKGALHIADGGMYSGNAKASAIVVEGSSEGSLESERIELGENSRVSGIIRTPHLAMAEGSFFNGEIHSGSNTVKTSFRERRKPSI